MFTATQRSAGGAKRGQDQLPVTISEHAQARWAARTPADISLKTAWEQSVAVDAPAADATAAHLYPPYDVLLLVKHATVTTVLHNDGRVDTPGLSACPDCGDLVDPVADDSCPWCGAAQSGAVQPGAVTLTRGEI